MSSQFSLLKTNRFAPLLITQFFGAFHDNLFKNAFVVLVLYGASVNSGYDAKMISPAAAGIFILPFVLFSALAGDLADKYPKHKIIRMVKLAEIVIAVSGIIAIFTVSIWLSFLTLFLLGTHSAFFGPSRYAILPEHLEQKELIGGNALINTAVFLAILSGTVAGTAFITLPQGKAIIAAFLAVCALIGYISSQYIPLTSSQAPQTKPGFNIISGTIGILLNAFRQPKEIIIAILGIAWFYFLGSMFLSQFPNYARETLGANEYVLTFFLILFSVGIAVGGLFNHSLLKGRISMKYVPAAISGITVFSIDLYFASAAFSVSEHLIGFKEFINQPNAWRIGFDILMISICGGLFEVPLSALIQQRTPDHHRARVLAGSAILNAFFIMGSSAISAALLSHGWSVHGSFAISGIASIFVAFVFLNRSHRTHSL